MMINNLQTILTFTLIVSLGYAAQAQTNDSLEVRGLYKLSIRDILQTKSSSLASGVKESALDAPAAMIVITAQDIVQRGYTSIDEVMADLPGFDIVTNTGPFGHANAYQRGYRTPYTQRTLLMIDGKNDNHLWSQAANLSRQYPLSSVERIEVLYGPASAVYGPNAFLGIVNIVTKKASTRRNRTNIQLQGGSFSSYGVDAHTSGTIGAVSYSIGGKFFKSNEEDLSDRWGFLSNRWYGDRNVWGPLLDLKVNNRSLGTYHNPSTNWGVLTKFNYKNWEIGSINWSNTEGFGPQYSADRGQTNARWINSSHQYYLKNQLKFGNTTLTTLALHRRNRIWGDWAEAEPDWEPNRSMFSYISYTRWNSFNTSWRVTSDLKTSIGKRLRLLTGIKYEQKQLTKSYDVPGYWDGVFSSVNFDNNGTYDLGAGIGYSTDASYSRPPTPLRQMPLENVATTHDVGGYLLGIYSLGKFRLNAGLRFDQNSLYGQVFNPRVTLIYKPYTQTAIKLGYGEAFQEPAPMLLWGGWSGRLANPDLKPERVRNTELNIIRKEDHFLHELSAYYAHYQNVIRGEAENNGTRDIVGIEYKLSWFFPGLFVSSKIKGYAYYSFTEAYTNVSYNHTNAAWEENRAPIGDIATHKLSLGLLVPISPRWSIHLRSNMTGERVLYSRNVLQAKGVRLAPSAVFNGYVRYKFGQASVGLKVNNMFNHHFLLPGVQAANGGDDFNNRSLGFYNSLIPNLGRFIMLNAQAIF